MTPAKKPTTERNIAAAEDLAGSADIDHALAEALLLDPEHAPSTPEQDEAFELLRTLLFDEYRQQIAQMRGQVVQLQEMIDALEQQIQDEEGLINTITPVIASAIRTNISGSRAEMIDALYPIMGKLVQRSVAEAMRDLVRRIDRQMRRTLNVRGMWRQFQAQMRGISGSEMTIRDALPLQVEEIFLIHKKSGLLLMHLSQGNAPDDAMADDSDIISGMLTAITEFTEDAFGRNEEEALNEIQYGGRSILLEAAHFVYIAVVIDGYDSSDFRNQMRDTMIAIEHRHASALRNYDGNAARFRESNAMLAALLRGKI